MGVEGDRTKSGAGGIEQMPSGYVAAIADACVVRSSYLFDSTASFMGMHRQHFGGYFLRFFAGAPLVQVNLIGAADDQ